MCLEVLILLVCLILLAIIIATSFPKELLGYIGGKRTNKERNSGDSKRSNIIKDLKKYPASKFEENIRKIFEKIFNEKFPTVLPDWLADESGKRYELDGYNEKLHIAYEAQGPLHYQYIERLDKTYANYYNRLLADAQKVKKSKDNNVLLVVIDYKLPKHLIQGYIASRVYDACKDELIDCSSLPEQFKHQPTIYVPVTSLQPYRNEKLEKELGLSGL